MAIRHALMVFCRSHGVSLNSGNLNEPSDRIAGHSQAVFLAISAACPRFFEDYVGMDKNDATAELVLSNIEPPEFECGSPPCWLSLNDLEALGFKVLNP